MVKIHRYPDFYILLEVEIWCIILGLKKNWDSVIESWGFHKCLKLDIMMTTQGWQDEQYGQIHSSHKCFLALMADEKVKHEILVDFQCASWVEYTAQGDSVPPWDSMIATVYLENPYSLFTIHVHQRLVMKREYYGIIILNICLLCADDLTPKWCAEPGQNMTCIIMATSMPLWYFNAPNTEQCIKSGHIWEKHNGLFKQKQNMQTIYFYR